MTITTESTTIGTRLRRARQLAGFEQGRLAEVLGLPRSSISAWENGHTEPLAGSFIRIAQVTGVSLDWLAWGVGPIEAAVVRPEGFEPPTFWLGVSEAGGSLLNATGLSPDLRSDPPRCGFCGDPHDMDDCPKAPDLDDELQQLLEAVS